jgi:hypothetical protein
MRLTMGTTINSKNLSDQIFNFLRENKKASIRELIELTGESRQRVQSTISGLRVKSENSDYKILSRNENIGEVTYEYTPQEKNQFQRCEQLLKSIFC